MPTSLAHRLLRSHVGRRADGRPRRGQERAGAGARRRLGDAEVGDLHPTVGGDHDVLGLEVAVHDAVRLGVREPGEHPLHHADELRERQPADVRPQRAARARTPSRCTETPSSSKYSSTVTMFGWFSEPASRDSCRNRSAHFGRARVEAAQLLQRDVALERLLPGEVHDRHPAASDLAHDLVAADTSLGRRHQAFARTGVIAFCSRSCRGDPFLSHVTPRSTGQGSDTTDRGAGSLAGVAAASQVPATFRSDSSS